MKRASTEAELMARWVSTLSPQLQIAWEFLTPEQRAEEFRAYAGRVHDAFQKRGTFALLAFHEHHPKRHLKQPDAALVRGLGVKAFRSLVEGNEE